MEFEKLLNLSNTFVLMYGQVGAGKTDFVRRFIKSIDTNITVSSPTFSIVNQYFTNKGLIYHIDLYRLDKIDNIFLSEIDEIANNHFLTFIEWPEKITTELKKMSYNVIELEF